jgi:transposase
MAMSDTKIFQSALGLSKPWTVTSVDLTTAERRLDIRVDFEPGAKFACPHCGKLGVVHDTTEKVYRHLDFFEHKTFLTARVPRCICPEHGVTQVNVPWSRPGSGFSLMFEGMVLMLSPHVAMKHLARYVGEHDTRLWRLVRSNVEEARSRADYSHVTRMAFDETATRRGHNYVTVAVDLDGNRVVFATPGKDSSCIGAAAQDLKKHGGDPNKVTTVACDMSVAFTKGIGEYLPKATITYDRFHVTKLVVDAVQQTRRDEQAEGGWKRQILKGNSWAVVTNEENQTERQRSGIKAITLKSLHLKTGRAYTLKLGFQTAYDCGKRKLSDWCSWASRSRLPRMVEVARSIRNHWDGVVSWFETDVTSAIMEGYNSLFQSAKSRARGYRNDNYFIDMIYLIAGKLEFTAVYPTHSLQR